MSVVAKNRDRILEAIDQLRRRKARPDIQRICNYLFRRYAVNSAEARTDLNWCVDNKVVLRVEYKGSISYRNAAKKLAMSGRHRDQPAPGSGGGQQPHAVDAKTGQGKRKFTQLLTHAYSELILLEPDYLDYGVPADQIVSNILAKDSVRYTKNYINILMEKEVESGGLIRTDNGSFLMGPSQAGDSPCSGLEIDESLDSSAALNGSGQSDFSDSFVRAELAPSYNSTPQAQPQPKAAESVVQVKPRKKPGPKPGQKALKQQNMILMEQDDKRLDGDIVRVGGRRKKIKKVFDPSDTHIPKKRGRPAGSLNKVTLEKLKQQEDSRPDSRGSMSTTSSNWEQGGVCSVCHNQNKKGPSDKMVACRECSNKAHSSCLNGDDMMLRVNPDNTWQCPHCKTCVVCVETSDAGNLVVCSVCADAYHNNCHQPPVMDKIKNGQRWLCSNCQKPTELSLNDLQHYNKNKSSRVSTNYDSDPLSGLSTPSNYRSPIPSPTPPHLSPQTNVNDPCSDSQSVKDLDNDDSMIDPSIPDATNWTYEEVYQYFAQYFPEEAKIFREQEIDGRSLLLLRRLDVLSNLKLKLGPALKIYRHVVKLQVRRDDPKLYWF